MFCPIQYTSGGTRATERRRQRFDCHEAMTPRDDGATEVRVTRGECREARGDDVANVATS